MSDGPGCVAINLIIDDPGSYPLYGNDFFPLHT